MKQIALLLVLIPLCWTCASDNDLREQAKAEIEATRPAPPAEAPAAPGPNEQLVPKATAPTTADALTLTIATRRASTGDFVCLPVTANGFYELIGLQYTLRWSPAELELTGLDKLVLEDLTVQNFGLKDRANGWANFSWIDLDLAGVSLSPDAPIYELCFTVKTPTGTTAVVRFDQSPLPFEVVNKQEEILRFIPQDGRIEVE